eukprot:SAG31_NODE_6590_length_1960_cov_2.277270_2_plen_267_part_00
MVFPSQDEGAARRGVNRARPRVVTLAALAASLALVGCFAAVSNWPSVGFNRQGRAQQGGFAFSPVAKAEDSRTQQAIDAALGYSSVPRRVEPTDRMNDNAKFGGSTTTVDESANVLASDAEIAAADQTRSSSADEHDADFASAFDREQPDDAENDATEAYRVGTDSLSDSTPPNSVDLQSEVTQMGQMGGPTTSFGTVRAELLRTLDQYKKEDRASPNRSVLKERVAALQAQVHAMKTGQTSQFDPHSANFCDYQVAGTPTVDSCI